jgi:adenylate cyclase
MPSVATEHRHLAAIMFTDMVGFTALVQQNEGLALELLEEHRRLLRAIFVKHAGREIKTTGDGFLLEFTSAMAAVQCAVEIQHSLEERNRTQSTDRQVQIRIGIHVGDVVERELDVLGDGVNIAARIEALAEPGGICLSNAVFEQVRNKFEQQLVRFGEPELKNIQIPIVVYRVVLPWQRHPPAALKPAPAAGLATITRRAVVRLALSLVLVATVWLAYRLATGPAACAKSAEYGNVRITKHTTAMVLVDLIGVSPLDKPYWQAVKPDDYWSAGSTIRKDVAKRLRTITFQDSSVFILSRTDSIWEDWLKHGTTELMIMADLPGAFDNGAYDQRRRFLPLDTKGWKAKDSMVEVEIRDSSIQVWVAKTP